ASFGSDGLGKKTSKPKRRSLGSGPGDIGPGGAYVGRPWAAITASQAVEDAPGAGLGGPIGVSRPMASLLWLVKSLHRTSGWLAHVFCVSAKPTAPIIAMEYGERRACMRGFLEMTCRSRSEGASDAEPEDARRLVAVGHEEIRVPVGGVQRAE